MDLDYAGSVLRRLKPFIRDGVLRRSRLERVLGSLAIAADEARPQIERLLSRASIEIEEDAETGSSSRLAKGAAKSSSMIDDQGRSNCDQADRLAEHLHASGLSNSLSKAKRTPGPLGMGNFRGKTKESLKINRSMGGPSVRFHKPEPDRLPNRPQLREKLVSSTAPSLDDQGEPIQQLTVAGATSDQIKDYLRLIGRVPLLNRDMEIDLAKRIEAGLYAENKIAARSRLSERARRELPWIIEDGRRAKNHLIEANLRLVVSVAKQYTGRGMLFLDLVQEGNLGLIHAVEKFDYSLGHKFSTYATWWIRQSVTRALADQARTIRIPVHMVERIAKVWRIRNLYTVDGKPPRPYQIAQMSQLTEKQVEECLRLGPVNLPSLDQRIGDSETTLGDLLDEASRTPSPDSEVGFILAREQIYAVLETLRESEVGVILMRFGFSCGEEMTLESIGKIYGVSRERIRQIESAALSKLRHPSRSQVLRDYLD